MPDTQAAGTPARQMYDEGRLGLMDIRQVSRTFLKSAMTDGGGTSGFIDMLAAIPPGSIILGWACDAEVAFTGDTTATVQVGVSGAVGDYSADTAQSIFAAGKVGSAALAASAADRIGVPVVARVTVTSTADFTNIVAGAKATVTVFYLGTS